MAVVTWGAGKAPGAYGGAAHEAARVELDRSTPCPQLVVGVGWGKWTPLHERSHPPEQSSLDSITPSQRSTGAVVVAVDGYEHFPAWAKDVHHDDDEKMVG